VFQQLNEFRYKAKTGKDYIIYFLKFFPSPNKKNEYIIKYQIRTGDKDLVWYGRASKSVASSLFNKKIKKGEDFEEDFKKLFVYLIKKGLDKGFEETNIEFVFSQDGSIVKQKWSG